MDRYNPLLEEVIFGFQQDSVVDAIQDICGVDSLYPDENLYAGGISLMGKNQFLNPHLDNSHEVERTRWRVLNLLYYVSPDRQPSWGGNLELWPDGPDRQQTTVDSRFNRLAVMAIHDSSWHSVSPITVDHARACVSNYYFSDHSLKPGERFHVTSFRGRPEQRVRDLVLRLDQQVRQGVHKVLPGGAMKTSHIYKKRS